MTQEYTTETGYYVLVDESGEVDGYADVPAGTHLVADNIDPEASFDVDGSEAFADYRVGEPPER